MASREDPEKHSQVIVMSLEDARSGSDSLQLPGLPQRTLGRQKHYSSSCAVLPERGSLELLGKLTETCKLDMNVHKIIPFDDPCQSYRLAETQCATSSLREPAPEPPTKSATVSTPNPDVEEGASDAKTKELKDMQKVLHKLDDILVYMQLGLVKKDLQDLENTLVDPGDDVSKPSDNNATSHRAVLEHLKGVAKTLHDIQTQQPREVSHDYVETRPSCRLHLQPAWAPLAESKPLSDHHTLSMSESLEALTRTLSPSGTYTDAAVKTVHASYPTRVSCAPEDNRHSKWSKVAQTSGAKWDKQKELSHVNQVAPVTFPEVLENKKACSSRSTPQVMQLSQCSPLPRSQFRCVSPVLRSPQISHRHLRTGQMPLGSAPHLVGSVAWFNGLA
eukprot:gnl/MRDRNA2_/MRDRNA2_123032_c0_seq1.p1 gnl/MRDRNA2_/MRDRNA2_123032_c0~~gnl/MRDRNA2_/MRDRNA2_123032_c0_seq1.p1  ORF type:complete len:390 (-),score=68.76 gnl/MRDRNA2_/MRDRNA2_123032_c0_seq1:499-1668(-)